MKTPSWGSLWEAREAPSDGDIAVAVCSGDGGDGPWRSPLALLAAKHPIALLSACIPQQHSVQWGHKWAVSPPLFLAGQCWELPS